jgi:hypothetical protein
MSLSLIMSGAWDSLREPTGKSNDKQHEPASMQVLLRFRQPRAHRN